MAQAINLQITPSNVMPKIYASQFDIGREIEISLYDGASAYTPPVGTDIRFEGKKPDGNGFSYACTYTGNVVTVVTTDQMTVLAGEIPCELRMSLNGDDIGTLNIIFVIEKSPIDENVPISDTEIPAIVELARNEQYNAEAWATGERNGVPVGPTDPQYHNNAKYFAEHAEYGALDDLIDVEITTPKDGDLLQYNSADDEWVNSSDVWDTMAQNGAHNLCEFIATTQTMGDVAFTVDNTNNIVTANNTSSGVIQFYDVGKFTPSKTGSYILSGCTGGSDSTYGFRLIDTTANTSTFQYDSEVTATLTAGHVYLLRIHVFTSGVAFSNQKFYPMIRLASDHNTDYTPYAPTNRDCMSYAANSKLGAHNLLRITKPTQVFNGVTFTINNETGVISMSGTVGSQYNYAMADLSVMNTTELAGKTVIVSGGSNVTNVYLNITCKNAGETIVLDQNVNLNGEQITIPATTAKIELYIIADSTYSGNLTVYPMIRLASDTDTTHAPYAMTNRELTENKAPYLSSSSVGTNISQSVSAGDTYTAPYDGIYLISCKNSGSSGTATINVNSVPIAMNDKPDMEYVSVPLKKGTVLQMRSNGSGTNYAYYIWSYFMA